MTNTTIETKELIDVREALDLPDRDDWYGQYLWRDSRYQDCLSLLGDIKDSVEQCKEDKESSLDELHELTDCICNRDVDPNELARFSKSHLDSVIAQLEDTVAYAERYSKSLPERAVSRVKGFVLDGIAWYKRLFA